jgi:serine/threonine protein kinase
LDEAGNAKVADFGTVREGVVQGAGTRVTHIVTGNRPGTRGYMAPECVIHAVAALAIIPRSNDDVTYLRVRVCPSSRYHDFGQVSTRTDAYSFGVILLELLMGLPAREVVGMLIEDRDFFDGMQGHVDARAGTWPKKVVKTLAGVAKGCADYRPRERATVQKVLPAVKALQKLLR